MYINYKRLDDCSTNSKVPQDKVVRGAKKNVHLLLELGRQHVEEGEPKELFTCSNGGGWIRRNQTMFNYYKKRLKEIHANICKKREVK